MSEPQSKSDLTNSAAFNSGDRLGKFTIQRYIARGGMGEVYKAWDNDLHRSVALKTLLSTPATYTADPQFRLRFQQEARTISHLEHENIVRVHELGEDPAGLPFIVMQFLEGENLQQRLSRSRGEPLPLEEGVAILLGASRGVDHCHRAGIVHRDLKPGNIFLTADQETDRLVVKVLDFGVAKPRMTEQGDLTVDGLILGTPSFMPPEQARGLPVDARSDQYALGALLYTCLAMRKPYEHVEAGLPTREERARSILRALRDGQGFPPPSTYRPDIPASVEAIVLRAMSADPDDRFGSVFEFSRELLPHASEDVRVYLRSYFDATPRAISQPQLSIAQPSSTVPSLSGVSAANVRSPFARREQDLPTTKSLRKPPLAPAIDEPTELSSAEPPPSGSSPPPGPGTAKMPSDVQALLRTATRPPSTPPEDSTSLAPSQVTATVRDRRVPRGSVALALAGTAALAIGLVVYFERADHDVAARPSAGVRPQPPLELLPAVHPHTPPPPSPAASPPLPTVIPKPDVPAPPTAPTITPVTGGDDPALTPGPAPLRARRDQNGNRVTVDKRGRRWAIDGSGRPLYQVDVTGRPL